MAIFYMGSFQAGDVIESEDPLETAWSYIERAATVDFLGARCPVGSPHIPYAAVRLRQAVELRRASRASTLLTKPLPLYYSALNLIRAGLAIVANTDPTPAHGLRHTKAATLLDNGAKVTQGTFNDFLEACGLPTTLGASLTLHDCLAAIPELAEEYSALAGRVSRAVPVSVRYDRRLRLSFDTRFMPSGKFESRWPFLFPRLATHCETDVDAVEATSESAACLIVKREIDTDSYAAIGRFCARHLENRLFYSDTPIWYAIKQTTQEPLLPRAAYYVAGLFVLSSIVRYQPECLADPELIQSEAAWLLGRFLRAAERFLPQLVYSWITGTQTYFGGA